MRDGPELRQRWKHLDARRAVLQEVWYTTSPDTPHECAMAEGSGHATWCDKRWMLHRVYSKRDAHSAGPVKGYVKYALGCILGTWRCKHNFCIAVAM